MRINSLKALDLILSLSKDEAKISCFFSSLLGSAVVVNGSLPHRRVNPKLVNFRAPGIFLVQIVLTIG
jgi:hypothetical protein